MVGGLSCGARARLNRKLSYRLSGTMSCLHRTLPSLLVALLAVVSLAVRSHAQEDAASTEPSTSAAAQVDAVAHEGEAHAQAAHEPGHIGNDPTHGNVSAPTYEVIDWRTDLALFSALVFLGLLAVLGPTAWKPIMQGLEKRERGIADNISRAEKAANEASAKLAEYEAKLAAAAQESQRIVAEARKDAEAAGQKLIAAAQEEAARSRDRAVADIESAKRVALSELASQSNDVAMSLARRGVGREPRPEYHQSLIPEILAKLPSNN